MTSTVLVGKKNFVFDKANFIEATQADYTIEKHAISESNTQVNWKNVVTNLQMAKDKKIKGEFNEFVNYIYGKKGAAVMSISAKEKPNRQRYALLAAHISKFKDDGTIPEADKPYRRRVFKYGCVLLKGLLEKAEETEEFGRAGPLHICQAAYLREFAIEKKIPAVEEIDSAIERYALITAINTKDPVDSFKKTVGMLTSPICPWQMALPLIVQKMDAKDFTIYAGVLRDGLVYSEKTPLDGDALSALIKAVAGDATKEEKIVKLMAKEAPKDEKSTEKKVPGKLPTLNK